MSGTRKVQHLPNHALELEHFLIGVSAVAVENLERYADLAEKSGFARITGSSSGAANTMAGVMRTRVLH
jgi:hypothetical protein